MRVGGGGGEVCVLWQNCYALLQPGGIIMFAVLLYRYNWCVGEEGGRLSLEM